MVISKLWHITVLELAKSGMKYLEGVKMADGIIESYLRRYPIIEEGASLTIPVCPKCKKYNITCQDEGKQYKYKCDNCDNLFGYGPDA